MTRCSLVFPIVDDEQSFSTALETAHVTNRQRADYDGGERELPVQYDPYGPKPMTPLG